MPFTAVGDYLTIKKSPDIETRSPAGLLTTLVDTVRSGVIISAGPGSHDNKNMTVFDRPYAKPGTKVYYRSGRGTEAQIDNEDVLVLHLADIIGYEA